MARAASSVMPDKPFAAIAVGLCATLVLIGAMRLAGYEPPPVKPEAAPAASRVLHVVDATEGAVIVHDAATGEELHTFRRAEGAFFRATLRALVNDRRRQGVAPAGNFRVEAYPDQKFYLIDEATGRALSLNAYGPGNAAVFTAFLSNQKKGEGQ